MALLRRIISSTKIFTSDFSASTTTKSKLKNSDNNSSDYTPVTVTGAPQNFKMENPFQSAGPSKVIEVDDVKNNGGTLVRVAMPGVSEDGFKVWTENSTVFFMGSGEIEFEEDGCGGKYGGSLEFSPEMYKPDEVKAEMKNTNEFAGLADSERIKVKPIPRIRFWWKGKENFYRFNHIPNIGDLQLITELYKYMQNPSTDLERQALDLIEKRVPEVEAIYRKGRK